MFNKMLRNSIKHLIFIFFLQRKIHKFSSLRLPQRVVFLIFKYLKKCFLLISIFLPFIVHALSPAFSNIFHSNFKIQMFFLFMIALIHQQYTNNNDDITDDIFLEFLQSKNMVQNSLLATVEKKIIKIVKKICLFNHFYEEIGGNIQQQRQNKKIQDCRQNIRKRINIIGQLLFIWHNNHITSLDVKKKKQEKKIILILKIIHLLGTQIMIYINQDISFGVPKMNQEYQNHSETESTHPERDPQFVDIYIDSQEKFKRIRQNFKIFQDHSMSQANPLNYFFLNFFKDTLTLTISYSPIISVKINHQSTKKLRQYIRYTFDYIFSTSYLTFKKTNMNFKEYICLNIFLNTLSILQSIRSNIQSKIQTKLTEIPKESRSISLTNIEDQLITILQEQFNKCTKKLGQRYPQSVNSSIQSYDQSIKVMREYLLKIDRRDNEQYDFLILKNIRYSQYYGKQDGQRMFIMKILKTLQDNSDKSSKQWKEFQRFNQIIYKKFIKDESNLFKVEDFKNLLMNQKVTIDKNPQCLIDIKIKQKIQSKPIKDVEQKDLNKFHSFQRILTKFIENLNDVVVNREKYTTHRKYPYKDLQNNLIFPTKQLNQKLLTNLKKLMYSKNLKKARNKISQELRETVFSMIKCYESKPSLQLQRQIDISVQLFKKLFEQTYEYLVLLIKQIIQAGTIVLEQENNGKRQTKKYTINLIQLKIGDIFRAKFNCTQIQFQNIVKFLNQLQEPFHNYNPNEQNIFKIVKISDKIQSSGRGILINYLFQNQYVCELQLNTLKDTDDDAEKLYQYCHLIYELNRGQFGIINQIATIIAANYSQKSFIAPYLFSKSQIDQKLSSEEKKNRHHVEEQIKQLKYPQKNLKWKIPFNQDPDKIDNDKHRIQVLTSLDSEIPPFQRKFIKSIHIQGEINQPEFQIKYKIFERINLFINIKYLVLTNNKITSIKGLSPVIVQNHIKQIIITHNKLSSLAQFQNLRSNKLELLDLSHNQLTFNQMKYFPISSLPALKKLLLNNNNLQAFSTMNSGNHKNLLKIQNSNSLQKKKDRGQAVVYQLLQIDLSFNPFEAVQIQHSPSVKIKTEEKNPYFDIKVILKDRNVCIITPPKEQAKETIQSIFFHQKMNFSLIKDVQSLGMKISIKKNFDDWQKLKLIEINYVQLELLAYQQIYIFLQFFIHFFVYYKLTNIRKMRDNHPNLELTSHKDNNLYAFSLKVLTHYLSIK